MVSILIPCFNAERWIGDAITSALDQTWTETEVIVVDDGSTDRSLSIIQGFGSRIRVESGPNRGGNAARNRLLELASGEWLQYLDADDYLLPGKIAAQMDYVACHGDIDIVYGPITIDRMSAAGREMLPIPEPRDPWILLAGWWLPQTGASLWRKQAVLDVGGWKSGQKVCQEHELYLRLLKASKRFGYCSENGAVWRLWGSSSLSLRNAGEVRRHRAVIEQDAEDYLRSTGGLTAERHEAINAARFRMARVAWREGDRAGARDLVAAIGQSAPAFEPTFEEASYRWLWSAFGFEWAEAIVGWRRQLRALLSPGTSS